MMIEISSLGPDWFGAIKHQAITWANVDPDQYPHMASLDSKDFNTAHH